MLGIKTGVTTIQYNCTIKMKLGTKMLINRQTRQKQEKKWKIKRERERETKKENYIRRVVYILLVNAFPN